MLRVDSVVVVVLVLMVMVMMMMMMIYTEYAHLKFTNGMGVCCPNMLVLSAGLQHSIDSVMLPTPRSLPKPPTHSKPRADHCNKEIKTNKATRAARGLDHRHPSWGEPLVKSMSLLAK